MIVWRPKARLRTRYATWCYGEWRLRYDRRGKHEIGWWYLFGPGCDEGIRLSHDIGVAKERASHYIRNIEALGGR